MMTILYEVGENLYVNITNKCPCACTFCIRKNGDGAYGSDSLWLEHEPSFEEIKQAFDSVDINKYNEIVFCGYGEPLVRIDVLIQICRYLKEKGCPPIRLNTNGLSDLLNERSTAQEIGEIFDIVSVSLNAGTKEEYMRVTRPKFSNAFEAMQKFASECNKTSAEVMMSVVDVIPEAEIEAAKKLCEAINVNLRIRKYES